MQQSKSGRFGIKKHTYLGFDWPFCRLKQIGFISIKLLVKINFMKEQSQNSNTTQSSEWILLSLFQFGT